jgi:outer membrane receptor protein involved in Fe transport
MLHTAHEKNMLKQTSSIFSRTPLAAIIALSLGLSSTVAISQETPAADQEDDLEVIMVTASKRPTSLQQTPIAVSVTSAEEIEQARVLDIQDLQTLVPTLRVAPLQRSYNTNFSIRGFGNGANNTGIEPSVGVFIDGVYRSRAAAQIGDLPRLEQIEILSGPQSTLFGKNASAGVINVRTAAPSFDNQAKVEFGVGNYGQSLLRGHFTGGLSDTLAFSLSGGINKSDGYTESVVGLGNINDRDRWNLRAQLLFQATDDVTIRFIADTSELDEACCTVADIVNGPTTAAVRALGGVVLDTADPFAFESALNIDPNNTVEDSGISMQIDVDFDTFALTSITALRNNDANYLVDVDYTSLDILTEEGHTEIETFTQELRLTSTGDNDFSWMAGAFFFSEEVDTGDSLIYGNGARPFFNVLGLQPLFETAESLFNQAPGTFFQEGLAVNSEFLQQNDAFSLFVNLDYKLTQDVTATFGASYTDDQKEVSLITNNVEVLSSIDLVNDLTVFGIPLGSVPGIPGIFIPTLQTVQFLPQQLDFPNAIEDGKSDDSQTTYSIRLAYELNRNFNFFATAATGFKATSWNLSRDTRPFPADQGDLSTAGLLQKNQSYGTRFAGPEESEVFEIGMKSRFKLGAFNITLFDQTIEGFQSSTFVGTGFVLANAGQQSTTGLEFDSVYRPFDGISLLFAGIILDPIYDSFVGASGVDENDRAIVVDLTGKMPAGIHERSFTLGIKYEFDFANGAFGYVRTDYIYESEARLVDNVPERITREVSTFNASAGLTFENGISLQAWVRNLNNDEYFVSGFPPPIQTGSFNGYPNQPRTFGASISYSF